ncbi:MAG: TadE/TadG family type IV pilus assembly protein [Desulfitobacteriaceae bacterium]
MVSRHILGRRYLGLSRRQLVAEGKDRGSVAILLALAFTALLGFAALVTDSGIIFAKHAHLQNAVDAAALAGVQELPQNPGNAITIAQDYALKNGVGTVNIDLVASNSEIIVSAQETVPTYLATIWGITSTVLGATAKAMMVPPTSLTGIVPLAIEEQTLTYGTEYELKDGGGEGEHGWYGLVQLSGPGAQNYEADLENGYPGAISVGQVLDVQHGNISGKTAQAVNCRLNQDERTPSNTFDNHDPDAPEIVYVPVVKILSSQGNSVQQVEVVGFAAFFLEGVAGMGHNSVITGRFIKTIVVHGQAGGSVPLLTAEEQKVSQGDAGFGLYTPKLLPE